MSCLSCVLFFHLRSFAHPESPVGYSGKSPYDRRAASLRIRNGLVSTVHALVCVLSVLLWFSRYSFDPFDWQRNMQGGIATPQNANGDAWFALGVCNTLGSLNSPNSPSRFFSESDGRCNSG